MLVASVAFLPKIIFYDDCPFHDGCSISFLWPLKYGIIPHLLDKEELVQGNAFVGGGTLAILIGTILGGLVVTMDNYFPFFAGSLWLASIGIFSSLALKKVGNANPNVKIDYTLFSNRVGKLKMTAEQISF